MDDNNSWLQSDAIRILNKHFGFLFDQGYKIYSTVDYSSGAGWPAGEVVLRKQDLFVKIYSERGFIEELSFRTSTKSSNEFRNIRSVVFALTGKEFVPNFFFNNKGYADLLRKYLNDIEKYFERDNAQNRE